MNRREKLYDKICRVLTDWKNQETVDDDLYNTLVCVQNNWNYIISEEECTRADLVRQFLDNLGYPYNDDCVEYIVTKWTECHLEQLEDLDEYFEIDEDDVSSFWFGYVANKMFM